MHEIPSARGDLVFVSYSREDAEWRRRFEVMLAPVARERRLEVWSDERNVVGDEWRPQLEDAIRRSAVALLLVTPDFLSSTFIIDEELPALVRHRVRLACVLVRPALWETVPALERVQWAHDPKRDGALAQSEDPEGQVVRVCRALLALLPDRQGNGRSSAENGALTSLARPVAELEGGGRAGELHGVPELPSEFVSRSELVEMREALLSAGSGAVGITGDARALGIQGQGGIGKTVLAAALARDDEVRAHFPDGVFWVTLGERPDLVGVQLNLLRRLGTPSPEVRTPSRGLDLLREALADRRCLLVVDDVWSTAAAAAFRATGRRGRVLYTTRDEAVTRGVGADTTHVDALSAEAARHLLARLAGVRVADLPAQVDTVLDLTGRVALALALVGAAVGRGGADWDEAVAALRRGGTTFLDHPYANPFKAMQLATATLGDRAARAYRSLAAYPQDTRVPVQAVGRYWAHVFGASSRETEAQLHELAGRELLGFDGEALRLHDLQRDFLLLAVEDVTVLHADLLDGYRRLLGAGSWSALPAAEPYVWDNLLHHLRGAGDAAAIRATVTDLAFLARRTFLASPAAAERDLRQASGLLPRDRVIGGLLQLFSQWGHVLAGHASVGDLASTLASLVGHVPDAGHLSGLSPLLPEPRLSVRAGMPTVPPALVRVLEGHRRPVLAVSFSPDGRLLASAGAEGVVRLWDPAGGKGAGSLEVGSAEAVWAVAFSRSGRELAAAGSGGRIHVWDTATGAFITALDSDHGEVNALAFEPTGDRLASAGRDGCIQLWDCTTGKSLGTLVGHAGWVNALAFSADGRRMASASRDGAPRLWDPAGGTPTFTLKGHEGEVWCVVFSPDGDRLASGGRDGAIRLWDLRDRGALSTYVRGRLVAVLDGHRGAVLGVSFSPDGRMLASASRDGTVGLWDVADGRRVANLEGSAGWVWAVAFAPRDGWLASAGIDGRVTLWDSAAARGGSDTDDRSHALLAIASTADGSRLASGDRDGLVRLWDPLTGHVSATFAGHVGEVWDVALAPDGTRLASAGDDGTLRIWDTATGRCTFRSDAGRATAVAFAADGGDIAVAADDGTVLWRVDGGDDTAVLRGHAGWVNALAFFAADSLLASAGDDGTVRIWSARGHEPSATVVAHAGEVWSLAVSPGGRLLAAGADDGTVWVWVRDALAHTLEGRAGIRGLAFSPDGWRLAGATWDGTVCLWDVDRAKPLSQVKVGAELTGLVWSDRGIAVASRAGVIRLEVIGR